MVPHSPSSWDQCFGVGSMQQISMLTYPDTLTSKMTSYPLPPSKPIKATTGDAKCSYAPVTFRGPDPAALCTAPIIWQMCVRDTSAVRLG